MWWLDVVVALVVIGGVYGFVVLVRAQTQRLSSHTDRTADQLYDQFADPPKRHRHFSGRRHRG